eukprot:8863728-Alexandrium_andersonii.AAC.1
MGCSARMLADDLRLGASGSSAFRTFKQGLTATHEFVQDMGGRLAPAKSINMSNHGPWRSALRSTWWPAVSACVPVANT